MFWILNDGHNKRILIMINKQNIVPYTVFIIIRTLLLAHQCHFYESRQASMGTKQYPDLPSTRSVC